MFRRFTVEFGKRSRLETLLCVWGNIESTDFSEVLKKQKKGAKTFSVNPLEVKGSHVWNRFHTAVEVSSNICAVVVDFYTQ